MPEVVRRLVLSVYEEYYRRITTQKEKTEYVLSPNKQKQNSLKKRILVYHIQGLGFGGTEKALQSIANILCDNFDVYFLTSEEGPLKTRRAFINKKVRILILNYKYKETSYPFYISGMNPHIKDVISSYNIDLIITADSGYTQYPINTIRKIPIVMINVFGSPTLQKNIKLSLFISKTVRLHAERYVGIRREHSVVYLPLPIPPPLAKKRAVEIRDALSIPSDSFVFGRIGRSSDDIFDPIGLEAFKKIIKKHTNVYYLIMSPPLILRKIIEKEKIPHVYFLDPSSDEIDIWGFHYAINCLAHFRKDGETYGMNITESMSVGNPIITHKSKIWNAHLEYLDVDFSRIADPDDVNMYENYMEEYITIFSKEKIKWAHMQNKARQKANNLFLQKEYASKILPLISKLLP